MCIPPKRSAKILIFRQRNAEEKVIYLKNCSAVMLSEPVLSSRLKANS